MNTKIVRMKTRRFGDDRGWFAETYSETALRSLGVDIRFVQDNQSFSVQAGTLRGLHFQRPPHAQAKLVRCTRGSLLDVIVDVRRGSPTYGQSVSLVLSADSGDQVFIPEGYAHGFVTLEPYTEIHYKVSDVYAPDCEGGIIWNDPGLLIEWPLPTEGAVLSDKDRALPSFVDFDSPFSYDGQPLELLPDL